MPAGGEYRYRLQRLILKQVQHPVTGQQEDRWEAATGAAYWCAVDELTGTQRLIGAANMPAVTCRVRIRQWPTIHLGDRLRDNQTGDVYQILGVVYGDNEWICDASRQVLEGASQ